MPPGTILEELMAIEALAKLAKVHHAFGAEDFLKEKGHPGAIGQLERLSSGALVPRTGTVCVCMIVRGGKYRFPDNIRSRCTDCRIRIEHRPDIPAAATKLCAFCALKRAVKNKLN